ncbi:MAG: hypothetical protein ABW003_07940 [Microvirga sp.]
MVFRQAAESRIVVNAHRINSGQMPEPTKKGKVSDFYFVEIASLKEHRCGVLSRSAKSLFIRTVPDGTRQTNLEKRDGIERWPFQKKPESLAPGGTAMFAPDRE